MVLVKLVNTALLCLLEIKLGLSAEINKICSLVSLLIVC